VKGKAEAVLEPMGLTPEVIAAFVRQIQLAFWRHEAIEPVVERLAHAAALAEREACAKVAEAHKHIGPFTWEASQHDRLAMYSNRTCEFVASAIRSREQAEARREEEK
jgi:hypothetical protein